MWGYGTDARPHLRRSRGGRGNASGAQNQRLRQERSDAEGIAVDDMAQGGSDLISARIKNTQFETEAEGEAKEHRRIDPML